MFETPRRNHPYYIVERTGIVLLAALFVFWTQWENELPENFWEQLFSGGWRETLTGALANGRFLLLLAAGVIPIAGLLALLWSVYAWKRTTFCVRAGVFCYTARRGFAQKETRVPLAAVSTVSIRRSPDKRLFSLASVRLELNSAAGARTKLTLVLTLREAEAFARFLETQKAVAKDADVEEPAAGAKRELRYSPAGVLLHVLLTVSLTPPVLLLSLWAVQFLPGMRDGAGGIAFRVILLAIAAFLFSTGVVQFVRLFGYTVTADDARVTVSHGLFNRQTYAFAPNKVNTVTVRQSLLARLCRRAYVEVTVMGYGNEKERPLLCLYAPQEEAQAICRALTADFGDLSDEKKPAHAGILQMRLLHAGKCLLLFCVVAPFSLPAGAALAGAWLLYGEVEHKFAARITRLCLSETGLRYTSGGFQKTVRYVRYGDIQQLTAKTDPIQKTFGNARLSWVVLAAKTDRLMKTTSFTEEVRRALAERIAAAPDASTRLWA